MTNGSVQLYGRGGADDGYALYSAVASVKYLQQHNLAHPHVLILIEAAEESGSPDLLLYMDKLMPKISHLDLIVTLDSECADYESVRSIHRIFH
jgi:acetylornithine deacetylase/succinyl-diaminopimelate desuccinylase-like protein